MKKKQQRLVAVRVAVGGQPGRPAIVPLEDGTIEDLLAAWRVVQIQPLGPLPEAGAGGAFAAAPGGEASYVALLLLEESADPDGLGRLGFGVG
jgi:hypothetical protein